MSSCATPTCWKCCFQRATTGATSRITLRAAAAFNPKAVESDKAFSSVACTPALPTIRAW